MAQSALEAANGALIKLGGRTILATLSTTGTTTEERACANRIDICKRALLRMHPWNFAIRRSNVEPVTAAITAAASDGSSDNEVRITSASHGLSTGNRVTIASVGGTTEANGTWIITVIDANRFDLVDSTFTNTYTSGGTWTLAGTFNYAYSMALPASCLRVLRVNESLSSPDWRVEGGRLLANDSLLEVKFIYDISDYTLMDIGFYECLQLLLAFDIARELGRDEQQREMLNREFKEALAKARFADATEDPEEQIGTNEWILSRGIETGLSTWVD